MVMPCRGCLHPQLYFIAALYTTFSRGRWPRLKAFFLVVSFISHKGILSRARPPCIAPAIENDRVDETDDEAEIEIDAEHEPNIPVPPPAV